MDERRALRGAGTFLMAASAFAFVVGAAVALLEASDQRRWMIVAVGTFVATVSLFNLVMGFFLRRRGRGA